MTEDFMNYEGPVVNLDIGYIPYHAGTTVRWTTFRFPCKPCDDEWFSDWRDAIVFMESFDCVYVDLWMAWRVQVWMGQCARCGRVYQTWECVWLPSDMKEVLDEHYR